MAKRKRDRNGSDTKAQESATRPVVSGAPGLPTWLPAVVFVGLTLLLFRKFVFSDEMLYGGDTLGLGYVARAFYAEALTGLGTFPRWAPLILGGTPFLEALSGGDSLYPPSVLLLLLMEPYRALGWKLVLHIALAGFFMFGWVRALGLSRPAALVSGVAYMLAPYLVSLVHPGHDGRIFVTALAPLLFWAVERHFVRPRLRSFTAIAMVVGAIILTTHFQMAYFLFGAAGLFAMFRAIEIWRAAEGEGDDEHPVRSGRVAARRFGLFLAASVAGAGIGAVQLLPAVDYVTEFSRRTQTTGEAAGESGLAWSSSWGMHPEEAMGLIIPEFAGNFAGGADWAEGTYWGRNAAKDNHEAAGLVVLLLAALAFVGGRRRSVLFFFAGLAAVAVLFSLGTHTPVWRIFYEVVPGVRLFRAPAQAMFLFTLSAATLAAFGVDRLLSLGDDAEQGGGSVTMVLGGATAALGLLALLASSGTLTSFWTSAVNPDLDPGRLQRLSALEPFIGRGAWISFLLALLTTGVAWALRAGYLAPLGAIVAVTLFVAVDEFRVSDGFVQVIDFQQWSAPDPNTQAVLRREEGNVEPYRMLSMRGGNGQDIRPALHGIELVGGHHPNDLARYRELIGMSGSSAPMNLLESATIRRLLNVRYILWPDAQFGSVEGTVVSRTATPDGRPYESVLAEDGLPRARLVAAAVVRPDEEAVAYMRSAAFDPEREVVLTEAPPIELDGLPVAGTVSWISRSPNELHLSVVTERPALLVVADNWFPAWHASVDGVDTPVLRAYHTMRAVPVGPGEHTVRMYYHSGAVTRGLWLSLLLLVGLTGATAYQMWRERSARGGTS